jgi:hypothetical protein
VIAPLQPPIDIGRGAGQDAARRELSKRIYHTGDRPLLLRAYDWLAHRLGHLLDRAAGTSPGGAIGLVIIVALVIGLIVVVWLRVGAPSRRRAGSEPLFEAGPQSAADHRRAADEHALAGEYADAVRERLRAIVRELEARGVLEPRAGRTADEVAAETAAVVPLLREDLAAAVRLFDDIWYGGRAAVAAHDAQLRAVDERVRTARLGLVAAGAP